MRSLELNSESSLLSKSYPWFVVTLSCLFLLYKYVMQVSPSVMSSELAAAYHLNGTGLGNLAASFFYAYMITQLFVGPLMDRYSPRLLSTAALLCCGFGTLLFALSSNFTYAFLARSLVGVGAAFATVSYMKFSSLYFRPERFALVGGLLATAAMVGALFGQTPLALMTQSLGWRHSLLFVSVLGFAIAFLFWFFLKDNHATANDHSDHTKKLCWNDFSRVLFNRRNWWLTFYSGLAFSPLAVLSGLWGNPFFETAYHLTKTQAANMTSFALVGLAVGGPLLGWMADRLEQRKPVMYLGVSLSLASLCCVIFFDHQAMWLLATSLFLFGFGVGSFMLGFAEAKRANPLYLAATVVAMVNTGDALFGAFTEPMVGKFLELGWTGQAVHGVHQYSVHDYHVALLVLPLYLLLALFCLTRVKQEPCSDGGHK